MDTPIRVASTALAGQEREEAVETSYSRQAAAFVANKFTIANAKVIIVVLRRSSGMPKLPE